MFLRMGIAPPEALHSDVDACVAASVPRFSGFLALGDSLGVAQYLPPPPPVVFHGCWRALALWAYLCLLCLCMICLSPCVAL